MILLITPEGDRAAAAADPLLRARGVPFVRLDPRQLPTRGSMTERYDIRGSVVRRLVVDGRTIDLAEVTAVWHRCAASAELPTPAEDALLQACSDLPARFLPAPPAVVRAAQERPRQLRLATAFGLEIPSTLVTTDPDELLAFQREHSGHVVTERDADSPVHARANVPDALALRIVVVGARVFAAEVCDVAPTFRRHSLPRSIADRCVAITDALGLAYAAIDLTLRPDGTYVFAALDARGEYEPVEQHTGLPITAAIVDWLDRPAANGSKHIAIEREVDRRASRDRIVSADAEASFAADPRRWDRVSIAAFPATDYADAMACVSALRAGEPWLAVAERVLGHRSGGAASSRSIVFDSVPRGHIEPLGGYGLGDSMFLAAHLEGRGPFVVQVRAVEAAVWNDATRKAVEKELFAARLARARTGDAA